MTVVFRQGQRRSVENGTVSQGGTAILLSAHERLSCLQAEGTQAVHKIEALPPSSSDDQLRIALYRVMFKFDSSLFR